MKLEPLMNYYANLVGPVEVGKGPFGTRVVIEVDGGEFEGPKLKGTIRKPACADWLLFDDDGNGHLDVRATFETHDGAYIYVQYFGHIIMTPAFQARSPARGRPTTARYTFLRTHVWKPATSATNGSTPSWRLLRDAYELAGSSIRSIRSSMAEPVRGAEGACAQPVTSSESGFRSSLRPPWIIRQRPRQ